MMRIRTGAEAARRYVERFAVIPLPAAFPWLRRRRLAPITLLPRSEPGSIREAGSKRINNVEDGRTT